MKPSVYIETTVVSYLTAWPSRDVVRLAHEIVTRSWWATSRGRFDLRTSVFTTGEAAAGDPTAAAERLRALHDIPLLPIQPDVPVLAKRLAEVLGCRIARRSMPRTSP